MIQTYRDGIDLHLKTGAELNGMTLKHALKLMDSKDPEVKHKIRELRFGGKAGNFGLIYGMQAEGYMHYARDTYGVYMTLEEATAQRDTFLQKSYPKLLDWHTQYQTFAHQRGYIRSPLGRIRHLPLINSKDWKIRSRGERQAINSPVQSTLSDMVQLAMAEFKARYGCPEDCRLFRMTHDELSAYVRLDRVDYWVPEVKHLMENLPLTEYFGWKPQLVFEVEAEMGFNLAQTEELKEGMVPSLVVEQLLSGS
jgi:DNA polymerase I-like protein with 3'-5' exonuclease and polymerase domains